MSIMQLCISGCLEHEAIDYQCCTHPRDAWKDSVYNVMKYVYMCMLLLIQI